MDAQTVLFYVFSAITVLSALRVISARNPVHSALFLVLAFCSAACIWMLLGAEFLAITLVLVYVGAVMVLFLFVVMMLDINLDRMREGFWHNLPVALVVGGVVVGELALVIWSRLDRPLPSLDAANGGPGNTQLLGEVLYTDYIYPVEIAAVILLVAIIAAIALTLRRRNVIIVLMAIELMLLAVNLNFIAFSHFHGDMAGQVFVFFILTVAAAESAIGLAILVVLFRNLRSIDVEDLGSLKG